MKSLLLLRHAKSSWSRPDLPDHDRPLKKRGRRDAPKIGRLLPSEGIVPGLILSSSAIRARETAAAISKACGQSVELRLLRDLYLAGPGDHVLQLRAVPDGEERVMIVGHNPGLEELLEALTGARETLPTAALALIQIPIEHWRRLALDGSSRLLRVWRPRELD